MTDTVIFGDVDLATVGGGYLTHNHLKKGGFTMAVAGHQSHPFAGVDLEADLFKQRLAP